MATTIERRDIIVKPHDGNTFGDTLRLYVTVSGREDRTHSSAELERAVPAVPSKKHVNEFKCYVAFASTGVQGSEKISIAGIRLWGGRGSDKREEYYFYPNGQLTTYTRLPLNSYVESNYVYDGYWQDTRYVRNNGYVSVWGSWYAYANATAEAHVYTHLSKQFPPYCMVTLSDIKLNALAYAPSAFADASKKIAFEWGFTTDIGEDERLRDQKYAIIEWKEKDNPESHTVRVSAQSTQAATCYMAVRYEMPANTLPKNSSFQWRIKIISDDDVEGDFSDWVTVSTTDVAGTVRAPSPDNAVVDGDIDNRFSWVYSNPYGTEPTGYEIEISSNNGAGWQQIKKATTSDCFADIPAGTLPTGNIQYRVRAFSQSGIESEWAVANITVRARPKAPSIYRIDANADRPTVWWESVDQEAYELKILDSSGSTVYTHYAALPDRSHKIAKRLDNAQYTAALTIWNGFGLDSPTAQRQFTLAAIKPGKPTVSGTAFSTHNSLAFVHTTTKSVLLRGGVAIADVSGLGSYDDYTAPASCEYRLRALSDTAFCDSDPLTLTHPGSGRAAAMSLASDHNVRVSLIYKEGSPPERSSVLNAEYALMQFAGRKLPVAEYGDGLTRTKSLSYSLRNIDDLKILRSMVGQTVVWNDRQDHLVACLSDLSWSERRGFVNVSFTITEIDSNEGIDYE